MNHHIPTVLHPSNLKDEHYGMSYRFRSACHLYTRGMYNFGACCLESRGLPFRESNASSSSSFSISFFPSTRSTPFNFLREPLPIIRRWSSNSRSVYRSCLSRFKRSPSSRSNFRRFPAVGGIGSSSSEESLSSWESVLTAFLFPVDFIAGGSFHPKSVALGSEEREILDGTDRELVGGAV